MKEYWRQVAETYDAVAKQYDSWVWQKFWRLNEAPIVGTAFAAGGTVDVSLDVGVGTGAYWDLHTAYSYRTVGIDVSVGMIDVLLRRSSCAPVLQAEADVLPFRSNTFGRILITRVLTHVPEIRPFLSEAWRVLQPGGELLVSDVDPEHRYDVIRFPGVDKIGGRPALAPQKHPLSRLTSVASRLGFDAQRSWRLRYKDLRWQPQTSEMNSLSPYSNSHIFYFAVLRKPSP